MDIYIIYALTMIEFTLNKKSSVYISRIPCYELSENTNILELR